MINMGNHNRLKKSALFIVIVSMVLVVFFSGKKQPIQAAGALPIKITNSLKIRHDNQTTEKIPDELALDDVAVGSTLIFTYVIENKEAAFLASITFPKQEGFKLSKNIDNFKINGNSISTNQYNSLVNCSGLELNLTNKTTIEMEIVYTGVVDGRMLSSIKVSSLEENDERNNTVGFEFSINTKYQPSYLINFFDYDQQLLDTQKVKRNKYAKSPSVSREGYQLIGFNTKIDGSGTYFKNEKVKETNDYYAVYKKKEYLVRYYINNMLRQSVFVKHGETAPSIQVEDTTDMKFIGWDTDLTNVQRNMNVYACFEDIEGKQVLDKQEFENSKNGKMIIAKFKYASTSSGIEREHLTSYKVNVKEGKIISIIDENVTTMRIENQIINTITSNIMNILVYILFLLSVLFGYKKIKKFSTKR